MDFRRIMILFKKFGVVFYLSLETDLLKLTLLMGPDKNQIIYWQQFINDGNLDSLSKVYFHYYDQLYDYGLRITSDKYAVEDAIQTEFLNLIRQRKNIGIVENLTGYLISSFRRQLLSDLNKQKQIVATGFISEEHFDYFRNRDPELSDKKNLEHIYRIIHSCIENLTDKQREIVYLRFQKEIPYETISEMLNISVDSCYKSLSRSINIIRTEVEKVMGTEAEIFLFFLIHQSLVL